MAENQYSRLQSLAAKYGTDKLGHGYIDFYEQHLPKEPKRILEIGVKDGASIKMWADYFPDAEIHGLDLFSEKSGWEVWGELMDGKFCSENSLPPDRIIFHTGNQCDWLVLEELRKYDFDVIIDDGSHNSRDQLITFAGLYNGKHYFIEDIHCCREEFYRQGLPYEATIDRQFDFDYPLRPFMKDRDENIIVFYEQPDRT